MLTADELTAVLALYQQVHLQEKVFTTGRQRLEMSFALFLIVYRLHTVAMMQTHPLSSELQQLLKTLKKVQSVSIGGKNLHRQCELDLSLFPSLYTLRLEKLAIRSVVSAPMVVDLTLVECSVEEDFFTEGFIALRGLDLERTSVPGKFLASLAYPLRRFSIRHNDVELDKTMWRPPHADLGGPGLIAWHALTHVSIRAHRPLFTELDASWQRLSNLTVLSLTSMQLPDLKGLDVLKHCVHLSVLDLTGNSLQTVHRISTFAPLVQKLYLANNSITTVGGIADLKELRHVGLEGNQLSEWAELRDLAQGCPKLFSLNIKANPIVSQMDDQSEVPAFVASIFEFRPLVQDGTRCESARKKVNPAFLAKHLRLLERNRSTDLAVSDRQTAPVGFAGRGESAPLGGTDGGGTTATSKRIIRRVARSLPSDAGDDQRSTASSPLPNRPKRRIVRGKVMPDKKDAEIALPSPQLHTVDTSSPLYVDVENLAEKHKERWLTAVSAQAAVAQRTRKKKDVVLLSEASTPAPVGPAPKTAAAPVTAAPATTPASSGNTPSKPVQERKSKAARRTKEETVTADRPPQAVNADEASDAVPDQAAAIAAAIEEVNQQQANRSAAGVAAKPQRQTPQREPTPLFQSLLHLLTSMDWSFVSDKDQRVRGFPSGCNATLSAICAENELMWGVNEEDLTSLAVHHTAVEVLLHDANDGSFKYASRFTNKRLVRIVEYRSGYTRTVRVETATTADKSEKSSPPVFELRPAVSVNFYTPLPTQPAESHIEVRLGFKGESLRKRASQIGRDRTYSELERFEKAEVDTSRVARDILRVMRPTLLAAFIIDNGPVADLLVDALKRHLVSCHSRLCQTKILRQWPMYLDDVAVKRDSDRSVPVKMSVNNVLDRARTHTDEETNRQRVGCSSFINLEDLRTNLSCVVFARELRDDRIIVNMFANLVSKSNDLEESSIIVIVTQKIVLIAKDHNFHGPRGATTAELAFKKIDVIPLKQLGPVTVSFNLQTLVIRDHIIQTREAGSTLSIIAALRTATNNDMELVVLKCPYEDITAAPLIFSVGVFVRPPGKARQVDKAIDAFPLRHIEENMMPASLVITATDAIILMELDTMTDEVSVRKLASRPLGTITAFGVAADGVNPLVFSVQYGNLDKGKKERWIFAAQHPNTVAAVYQQLRQHLGQRMEVVDLTVAEYISGN